MKITITFPDGNVRRARLPWTSASHVICQRRCPCGSNAYVGNGPSIESRDTYRADAKCDQCGAPAGVMRTKVDTLFGIEEDERVLLHGRCRVY